jgi:transposase InsO family protein
MMLSAPTGHPEGWYNSRRRHSVLDYLSPMAYEKRALVQV